ncbi:hypothetical protein RFI_37598, partial [Reticulomyxa filosa]
MAYISVFYIVSGREKKFYYNFKQLDIKEMSYTTSKHKSKPLRSEYTQTKSSDDTMQGQVNYYDTTTNDPGETYDEQNERNFDQSEEQDKNGELLSQEDREDRKSNELYDSLDHEYDKLSMDESARVNADVGNIEREIFIFAQRKAQEAEITRSEGTNRWIKR